MTLSIYDPTKGCFVLKPIQPPIINAFHPDYVKTYMPEFLSDLRVESTQKVNGSINGAKSKATRESIGGKSVNTIDRFPKHKAKVKRVSIENKPFYIFSQAGDKNVTPKGKKK